MGRGLARKPARVSGGRGQVLVNMLTDKGGDRGQALAAKLKGTGAGRGTVPSPRHQWEGQNRGEDRQTPVPRLIFPHPSPCIWTTRVLWSLTPRPPPGHPGGWSSPPLNCQSTMYDLKWQPMRKKRRLLEPPLTMDPETGMRGRGHSEEMQEQHELPQNLAT